MNFKNYQKICKRMAALCKTATRVIYDAEPDYIYISEEHTLFKIPATAEAEVIYEKLFSDRNARGRHGIDIINEGTAKKIYNTTFDAVEGLIEKYIFSVSEKYAPLAGTKAGWRLLSCGDVYRAINTKFIDIFAGCEATFSGDKSPKNPALVVCGECDISGIVLPFNMPKENIAGAIKASEKIAAEKAAEKAGKSNGVYFESGIDSVYIDGGRRDDKTAARIIWYYAGKKGWDPDFVKKAAADRATLDDFKKRMHNVTAEKKTRDNGSEYINFYDKKDFFRTEEAKYSAVTDEGIMFFFLGINRDALRAAYIAEHEPATAEPAADIAPAAVDPDPVETEPATAKTETAAADHKEPDAGTTEPENAEKRDIIARVLAAIADAPTKNASAILKAGIAADAFTTAELVDYLKNNTLPAVHTFKGWISAGYSVKKGEKALFKADIYEHIRGNYYKRTAAFFGPAQVEKIEGARA